MADKILEILSYSIPSLITGLIAYYFFLGHTKSEENTRNYRLLKENQKAALPLRLQAYERMTLFMERINPSKLLVRVTPTSDDKDLYVQKLIQSIEQEFEHNLAQQIYITEECWSVIVTSKNATTHIIKKTAENIDVKTAQNLREAILNRMVKSAPPSNTALSFIKEEVGQLF
ncbi:DUF7935 family protein [Urechidicola croceus]|uniref:Uncharacterized protein n=1 Tax=Urechidicola croceus TaxID=1850246 RepID=A0A1D8P549_9FLAO|nr:hypothetical protein [Urechidicola croceus]AOW19694.1 hypothetical protein LPB138_02910 [Urechidicola croceus]